MIDAAKPIGYRKIRYPSKMLYFPWSSLKFGIFVSLMLVMSVAHFSPDAPEFVVESVSSKLLDIFYLLVGVTVIFYGLISQRGLVGKNVEMEMGLRLNKASIDYVEEMLQNAECVRDFEFGISSYEDCGNAEWLGLPVRSLKSVVDERKGGNSGDGGLFEEGDWAFGELISVNLLEKFNEASVLLPRAWDHV